MKINEEILRWWKVLERDSGDGSTTLWIYLMPLVALLVVNLELISNAFLSLTLVFTVNVYYIYNQEK